MSSGLWIVVGEGIVLEGRRFRVRWKRSLRVGVIRLWRIKRR